MKYRFRLSDREGLSMLRENWLIFLYEFFEEKTAFHTSQTVFLAFLDPSVIKSHEHSRILLFAHNRGKNQRVFESSISIGLLQGKSISRIKHAPPFKFAVWPEELICVEFPLKGDKTPVGKYRIGIHVKDSEERVRSLGEKFSIQFVAEFISQNVADFISGGVGIPSRVLTGWTLHKLKSKKIHISKADTLYLGTTTGVQYLADYAGTQIKEEIKRLSGKDVGENVGTALSGVADGVLSEMFDRSSPSLTLTVV